MILGVVEQTAGIASRVVAVADRSGRYADLGIETIPDRTPGRGPLSALDAALTDRLRRAGTGWLCLASCDLVELEPDWIRTLAETARDGDLAVAFHDGRWQPMPALYHTDAASHVAEAIAGDHLAMQGLLDKLWCRRVAIPDGWPAIPSLNTREALRRAESPDSQSPPPAGDEP